MGYKHDQRLPAEIHEETIAAQLEEAEERLPPYPGRYTPDTLTIASSHLAATSEESLGTSFADQHVVETLTLAGSDPRATSQESLVPVESQTNGKRILLLVYIHGFMGNETSFASFPAHIHSLLTEQIKATHAVHSKVYPRYKTRNNIRMVRDQFSGWLAPHESPTTDIILLGHSMGGIVAAEVALIPSISNPGQLKHRILGTLNLDVPFLGMHPGIIGAGLSSIFGNADAKAGPAQDNEAAQNSTTVDDNVAMMPIPSSQTDAGSSSSSLSPSHLQSFSLSTPDQDPYYNPSFANDLPVPVRKPMDNIFHFVDKHLMKAERGTDLLRAGGKLITSHLEFGGTMAQYTKLDSRYKQLRALEQDPTQVRFVNYFSTCYGRPKPVKAPAEAKETVKSPLPDGTAAAEEPEDIDYDDDDEDAPDIQSLVLTKTDPLPEPELTGAEEHGDAEEEVGRGSESDDDAFEDAAEVPETSPESEQAAKVQQKIAALPPIPAEPEAPAEFEPDKYEDKDAQKLAKQLHARELRAYNQAVKDRNAAVKEREKLTAKYEKELLKTKSKKEQDEDKAAKKAAREKEAAEKKAEKQKLKEAKLQEQERAKAEKQLFKEKLLEEQRRVKSEKQKQKMKAAEADASIGEGLGPARVKEKKLKTFCLTPPKATTGQRADWIPVFVKDSDQVTAHCGLFNEERPHYVAFVRQVTDTISDWTEQVEGTLGLA